LKKYPSIKKDIAALGKQLLVNPVMGTSLGNNCYKIRMTITSKDTGKSGGAYFGFFRLQIKVYLYELCSVGAPCL
jgi:hypothetical protein